MQQQGLQQYIRITREKFVNDKVHVRVVCISQFKRFNEDIPIDQYIADKAPFFYRQLNKVIDSLQDEALLTSVRETLAKLPTSETFQDSHFGEILAGLFCQDILQLKKIYSKLSLLTAENANAFKMDLVLYDPKKEPIEIYFGEVKFSPKLPENGKPVKHDESCFKDLFDSFNSYTVASQDFDFAAAKDHLDHLPETDRNRLKEALKPYSKKIYHYLGFTIIDTSTLNNDEISVLATRKNKKEITVDVICLDELPDTVRTVYQQLEKVRDSCTLSKK